MPHPLARRSFLFHLAASGSLAALAPKTALSREFQPGAGDSDAAVFAAARREFLFPDSVAYCQTGTLGASPREVVDALVNGIQDLERHLPDWPYTQSDGEPLTGYQPLLEFRAEAGAFLNAPAEEIALTQNSTMGMSFLANGLDLAPGDEVLSTDHEHPGGISAWRLLAKRRGVVVKELPLDPSLREGPDAVLKLFRDAFTNKTRVLVFSHVTSAVGALLPARELCALASERGALSIVDGAQAVGQIRVDVKAVGCDVYLASPHKWLLAPKGTGLLYIRKEVQPRVWTTLASASFNDQASGAYRFMQYGTGSLPVVHGLRAALRFMSRIGMERIERWDAMLTKRLREGLAHFSKARLSSPADPRMTAAITTFAVAGHTGRELQDALWEKKIRVRAQGGERGIRLSAHLYVSPADIDRVLEVVSRL
jgi:selenocysteine lyase/cysteine desulfurase